MKCVCGCLCRPWCYPRVQNYCCCSLGIVGKASCSFPFTTQKAELSLKLLTWKTAELPALLHVGPRMLMEEWLFPKRKPAPFSEQTEAWEACCSWPPPSRSYNIYLGFFPWAFSRLLLRCVKLSTLEVLFWNLPYPRSSSLL